MEASNVILSLNVMKIIIIDNQTINSRILDLKYNIPLHVIHVIHLAPFRSITNN